MTAERRRRLLSDWLPAVSACLVALLALAYYRVQAQGFVPARVPAPEAAPLPGGRLGDSIRLGRALVHATPEVAGSYVGSALSCADCHLRDGQRRYAAPFAGLSGEFPAWNRRAGRVITLTERIDECFVRSENGTPPPANGRRMTALLAYMAWLSRGVPAGDRVIGRGFPPLPPPARRPSADAGWALYRQRCAACHGAAGGGHPPSIPPLWGAEAYNQGAGMNHVRTMAAFVHRFMPLHRAGSLTPQQAYDVAAYVHAQPHPKLKPGAARY
jgi:thiosulfate dehydrogenase